MERAPVICLMGPTAAGKTSAALRIADEFPVALVSVDSALVYRGMDIGTAKPDPQTLARVPHELIDIRDPEEAYSAGDFVRDATATIRKIRAQGRIPLLVGGTMLYFRALIDGMAILPAADRRVRADIDREAAAAGWPGLHAQLGQVDAESAARIDPHDAQRIQRALEVYRVSGRALSEWHRSAVTPQIDCDYLKIALIPASRANLHERIAQRLERMMAAGFLDEVRTLMSRPALTREHSSMRAVGYRQLWAHLAGETARPEAEYRALVATRQLCKRQLTWLRSDTGLHSFDPLEAGAAAAISSLLAKTLNTAGA